MNLEEDKRNTWVRSNNFLYKKYFYGYAWSENRHKEREIFYTNLGWDKKGQKKLDAWYEMSDIKQCHDWHELMFVDKLDWRESIILKKIN